MLYGISFIDLAFLKSSNIIDNRLLFQRKKTSKPYNIKITSQLQEIISYYLKDKSPNDFIFPIISRETFEFQYKDVVWARKRYNKGLKEIAKLCGIEQRLTSYVSRHSFVTHAMFQNVPLQAISAMLGHNKLTTTQIYLKSLPSETLDDYNKKLVEL
jgi:site-specific recombinase XerD